MVGRLEDVMRNANGPSRAGGSDHAIGQNSLITTGRTESARVEIESHCTAGAGKVAGMVRGLGRAAGGTAVHKITGSRQSPSGRAPADKL
jgi:hypothetical protein